MAIRNVRSIDAATRERIERGLVASVNAEEKILRKVSLDVKKLKYGLLGYFGRQKTVDEMVIASEILEAGYKGKPGENPAQAALDYLKNKLAGRNLSYTTLLGERHLNISSGNGRNYQVSVIKPSG